MEAPEAPREHETSRVHIAARRRCGHLAARGARAARSRAHNRQYVPETFAEPFRRYMKAIGWEEGRNIHFLFV
jgi:hypothetical protein